MGKPMNTQKDSKDWTKEESGTTIWEISSNLQLTMELNTHELITKPTSTSEHPNKHQAQNKSSNKTSNNSKGNKSKVLRSRELDFHKNQNDYLKFILSF